MSKTSLIQFQNIEIEAAERDGMPFANLKRLCEDLGVGYQSQARKLTDVRWATIIMMMTVGEDGRQRQMSFLSADSIPMWLVTIRESKVAEHIRPLLRALQLEARDVLYKHFGGDQSAISVDHRALIDMRSDITGLQEKVAILIQQQIDQSRRTNEIFEELLPAIRRIDDRTKGTREEVSPGDKRRLIACVNDRYHGDCPCCRQVKIVENGKRIADVSQIDHYHHRSMAALEYVWLVCKSCNRKLRRRKPGEFWMKKGPQFQAFQEILWDDSQMMLSFMEAR